MEFSEEMEVTFIDYNGVRIKHKWQESVEEEEEKEQSVGKKPKLEDLVNIKIDENPSPNKNINIDPAAIFHRSPKKRLNVTDSSKPKQKFIYGNYSRYYGYRIQNKDFHDLRLDAFAQYKELFEQKDVLDIGCNSGLITMEIAKQFNTKSITGLDIDHSLINQAQKQVIRLKKQLYPVKQAKTPKTFPFNVHFVHGNYVLRNDVLLEIEREQFDVILCLSLTKWIQLNFGDNGLKQAFRRMFLQLRSGGTLVLESQPFQSYRRRSKLTENIHANYKAINLRPERFTEYLLSADVGFDSMELLAVPEHRSGFKRPILLFYKK